MVKFIDGPAGGRILQLSYPVPIMLRVVHGPQGWDALDKKGDEPRVGERCYAYRMVGPKCGWCHVRRSGGRGGRYAVCEYSYLTPQPPIGAMDTRDSWEAWITAKWEQLFAGRK